MELRLHEKPSAILQLLLPSSSENAAGWCNGRPKLPEHLGWPHIEGEPLHFVVQIDLAKVPTQVWSGSGPRLGHLAIFMNPVSLAVKALHFDGALQTRAHPITQTPHWISQRPLGPQKDPSPTTNCTVFEWPFALLENRGEIPTPSGTPNNRVTQKPIFHPYENETLDFTNPAHLPFDAPTLAALVDNVQARLDLGERPINRALESDKITEAMRNRLEHEQAKLAPSKHRFDAIRNALTPYLTFFSPDLARHIPKVDGQSAFAAINELTTCSTKYLDPTADGKRMLEVETLPITEDLADYQRFLERRARCLGLTNPDMLPPESRKRFEQIWAHDTLFERGGLGHTPHGEVESMYNTEEPREVLLELPTSALLETMWGDMYSVVLTLPRSDLADGNFENVVADITN